MLLVEVHNMRAEEVSNNADTDPEPAWVAGTKYQLLDEVLFNDLIYVSTKKDNLGKQPDTSPLFWTATRGINYSNVYDVYPDTFTIKNGANLVLSYNVAGIDTIFLGNIHGGTVTVTAGATFSKAITNTTVSPLTVWGLKGYEEIADFYIELASYTGTVTVTITPAPSDNIAGLGFINYGVRASVGCTLIDSIKYNVRSGVSMTGNITSLARLRASSWSEMILPIRIPMIADTLPIVSLLSKYRGVPILIIGDDLGVREETIFYGVYTDIEASLTEFNQYSITLRSLRYNAFIPPTDIEESQAKSAKANKADKKTDTKPRVYADDGVPTCAEFEPETMLIFNSDSPRDAYYCDGTNTFLITPRVDHMTTIPVLADFTDGTGRDIVFSGCDYYRNNGGVVTKCEPKVTAKAGVPLASDFANGANFILNSSSPCDMYYITGATVKKCEPPIAKVTSYVGVPPLSLFTGGVKFAFDEANPCDLYSNVAGTVTKCGGGGGGGITKGVAVAQGTTVTWLTYGIITGVTKGVSDITVSITATTAGVCCYAASSSLVSMTYPVGTGDLVFLDNGKGVLSCYSD